jgi:dTDP-4-dehydrorhamnose reductase
MTIIIFGSEGQLGQDLVETLSSFRLVCPGEGEVDVGDRSLVLKIFESSGVDWAINAAAMTHVDNCESQDLDAYRVNALGARYIAQACESIGARLIHISTDYVFDGKKGSPYVEEDPTHPLNVYGITKLAGEYHVRIACPNHYILRTSGLYGTHKCVGKGSNFVDSMLRLSNERDVLSVVDDEVLTPTFTLDLANQIRLLIEATPSHGIYHATNTGACSWYEFAAEIFKIIRSEVKLKKISAAEWKAPAKRPGYSVLENAALIEAGINTMPDWKDALERYLSLIEKR